ncbi:MAG: 3-dehydroquinate synthase [Demequinaceae bacterium]|nr:3-dehydroquinate synthase [Demequinaceae bacterium]
MSEKAIRVEGAQPYDVTVGSGVLSRVPEALPERAERVLLIHSRPLTEYAARMRNEIEATGRTVVVDEVPDAEAGKTAQVLAGCWSVLGREGFTRSDVVVGLGGGAVTDLAGFVAASWLRGVTVVQVPTSLLGMVDAAIGGKTGINTEEGKNLVGAFHAPASVWCDTETLRTLPREHVVAGLGEVVKAGFIRDQAILELVEENLETLGEGFTLESALPVLERLIVRAIRVKADVVGQDFREAFLREILNYGHTFGHAIEQVEDYRWRHGEAVAVGMVFAAELARQTGRLTEAEVDQHRRLCRGLGLPVSYPSGRWEGLLEAMRRDKKTRGSLLRFVVLEGIGNPVRLEGPDEALLRDVYDAISE